MGDRAYTLAEIDRMRKALRKKLHPPPMQFSDGQIFPSDFFEKQRAAHYAIEHVVEDQLRTCMTGGVDPAELEQT